MEPKLLWGLGLLAASILLLVLEIFIPSAGVISFIAAGCAVVGVVSLFLYDAVWGVAGLLTMLIAGPGVFFWGLSLWRHTPIGRKIIGETDEEAVLAQRRAEEEAKLALQRMVGTEGIAATDLRPVGVVIINGQRYDALSEMSLIAAGTKVRVTVVDGNQIKVRAVG